MTFNKDKDKKILHSCKKYSVKGVFNFLGITQDPSPENLEQFTNDALELAMREGVCSQKILPMTDFQLRTHSLGNCSNKTEPELLSESFTSIHSIKEKQYHQRNVFQGIQNM